MLPFLPVPHGKASGCSRARRGSRRQTRKEVRNQTRQHNHRLISPGVIAPSADSFTFLDGGFPLLSPVLRVTYLKPSGGNFVRQRIPGGGRANRRG